MALDARDIAGGPRPRAVDKPRQSALDRHHRGIDAGILGGGRHGLQSIDEVANACDLHLLDTDVMLFREQAQRRAEIQTSREPHAMERVSLQEGGGDDRPKALPLVGILVETSACLREPCVQVRRHDVPETLAPMHHQRTALRDQEPQNPHYADLERLGYEHLIGRGEQLIHLSRAPGDALRQRRYAAENPQLRSAPVHVPQAGPRAFSGHDQLLQLLGLR